MLQNNVKDTKNDKYQHFIRANKKAAKEIMPMKASCPKIKHSDLMKD